MAWEYYTFLGLQPDADLEEIKRAAARKRRELEIARDTPGKAHLNEVTRVLRDAQARAEYDLLQRHGDKFSHLLAQAQQAEGFEDWLDAIRLYRQALTDIPDHPLLLGRLGYALAENGNFREAEKIYAGLVKRFPESPVYWASYGAVCFDLASRIPTQQPASKHLVDVVLTGVQSARRLTALQTISKQLDISYDTVKVLAKSPPSTLLSFSEKGLAENIARTLRAAGALVKVTPSQGRSISCPYCANTLYLPADDGRRSIICSYCGESVKLYKGERENLLRQGREYYQRAISLDPTNTEFYLELALSYNKEGQYTQTTELMEKAILADGVVNFDDLAPLVELCRLYSIMGQMEKVEQTVERIRAVMPDDTQETREMIGSLFALVSLTEGAHQRFDSAKTLAEIGLRFTPGNAELLQQVGRAEQLADALREMKPLLDDMMIIDPVRDITRVLIAETSGQSLDPQQAQLLEKSFDKLYDFTRNVVRASIKRMRTKYPAVYALIGSFFAPALGDAPLGEPMDFL